MKKFKQFIVAVMVLTFGALLVAPLSAPVYAATDPNQEACDAINCDDPQGLDLNNVIEVVVQMLSLVIGIVAVIMVMISGFKYITAAGDSTKVASAKNTLIYAIIGLVLVALAQFIVQFVIKKTDGAADKTTETSETVYSRTYVA